MKLIPVLKNEVKLGRGESKQNKDDLRYEFRNGSVLDILAASERSRGQRRTSGAVEEAILVDGDILNEVIIPTTNVDRLLPDGITRDPNEVPNKAFTYITTAGYKNTFAYDKLIEVLVQSIVDPNSAMILGGSYKIPVYEGLLNEDFVEQLQLQGTYSEEAFDREYCSKWAGSAAGSFFSLEKIDQLRVLPKPETENNAGPAKNGVYYVIGVDVGRLGCSTVATIIKTIPQIDGPNLKAIVNVKTYDKEDFEQQAIALKKLYYQYKARILSIDANGLGVGLIDFMTKEQKDPETQEVLPPFGVEGGTNEESVEAYKKATRKLGVERNAMYLIKANAPLNTEMYSYAQTQIGSQKVRFLIDEVQAKAELVKEASKKKISPVTRNLMLAPYVATTALREEMLNLREEQEGLNIILKPANPKIKHDKFSSFIYGMYYIKKQEENRRRRNRNFAKMMFFK